MKISNDKILDILKKISYPGSDKDIVSLGIVKDIKINENIISFSLFFDKSNNPFISSVKRACINAIHDNIDKNLEVNIDVKAEKIFEEKNKPSTKNIIAIASGKGGVGKSTVAANIAVTLAKLGYKTGLLDADIYGPSIPKMFGTENTQVLAREENNKTIIIPLEKYGVKLLSIGYFVKPNDALIWRGPMATGALRQLIHDAEWNDLDYLLIDLPPGTGDIHLTLVQEIAVTGVIIVSTPQQVALADAIKGISMFSAPLINVPVLGLVENMAWFTPAELPDNKYYIFGKDGCKNLAQQMNIPLLGQIPIVQSICDGGDNGLPAALNNDIIYNAFELLVKNLIAETDKRNKNLNPTEIVKITK
jgi:ATP-binding protein involved in chromosome partitioning